MMVGGGVSVKGAQSYMNWAVFEIGY